MLTLYHGSPKQFFSFEIKPELSQGDEDRLAEGYGIYLTEDKEMAKAYGKYLYVVKVEEENVSDFTNKEVVKEILLTVLEKINVPPTRYINIENICNQIVTGNLPVIRLHRELENMLDNNQDFYSAYNEQLTYEEDCLFKKLEEEYFAALKDVVRYYDKSFEKDIFICFRNEEQLSITSIYKDNE